MRDANEPSGESPLAVAHERHWLGKRAAKRAHGMLQ